MSTVDIALVVAGLGTFLLRYLPMAGATSLTRLSANSPLYRVLQAMGPAAIAALVAVSLVGLLAAHAWSSSSALAITIGVAAVFMVRRFTDNLALATLIPALAYGTLLALFSLPGSFFG